MKRHRIVNIEKYTHELSHSQHKIYGIACFYVYLEKRKAKNKSTYLATLSIHPNTNDQEWNNATIKPRMFMHF